MSEQTEPFPTNNRKLAIALITAGCSFYPQTETTRGPATNLYTIGFCRQFKALKGLPLEVAVRRLIEKKIPGVVTYLFLRDDLFFRCIKAWDEMVEEMKKAKGQNRAPILPDLLPEQIMQTIYMGAINERSMVDDVPWFNVPLISDMTHNVKQVPIEGKADPKTVITGQGKIWSLGASKKIKDKLRIK